MMMANGQTITRNVGYVIITRINIHGGRGGFRGAWRSICSGSANPGRIQRKSGFQTEEISGRWTCRLAATEK